MATPREHKLRHKFASPEFITLAVSLAAFTETFLYGLIIPLLPFTLRSIIHLPPSKVQTAIAILLPTFGLGSILGAVLGAVLASHTSNRVPYLLGLITMIASTAMFAFGKTLLILIISRGLQGFSSAIVWTIGVVMISEAVDDDHRGRSFGFMNSAGACGYMLGPVFGGVVYEWLGYGAVYAVAGVLLLIDVVFRLLMRSPESSVPVQENFDSAALGPDREDSEESSHERTGLLSRTNTPEIHETDDSPAYIRSPLLTFVLSSGFFAVICISFTEHVLFPGLETILPVQTSRALNFSPSMISLLFLLMVLPTLFAPLVGGLSDRLGPRVVSGSALLLCVPCLVALSFVNPDFVGRTAAMTILFPSMTILGFGIAGIVTPIMGAMGPIAMKAELKARGLIDKNEEDPESARESTKAQRQAKIAAKKLEGIGFSAVNIAMQVAAIIAPLGTGWAVEKISWAAGPGIMAGVCGICSCIMWTCL